MAVHRIDRTRRLRPVPAGEPSGTRPPLQGAPDRRDQLLPRPGRLGRPPRSGPPRAHRGRAGGRHAPGLGGRLLDRRGGLLPRHRLPGGARDGRRRPKQSRSRSSRPTSTATPSTGPGRRSTRRTSRPTSPPSGCSRFFAREEDGLPGRRRRSGSWSSSPSRTWLTDPPFTRLDLLSCRNLLIYLAGAAAAGHPALPLRPEPGRGPLPRVGRDGRVLRRLFSPVDPSSRSTGGPGPPATAPLAVPTAFAAGARTGNGTCPARRSRPPPICRRWPTWSSCSEYAPAAVLTTADGDILYINGETGRFLEPASGKANWNIFAMARDGLRAELERRVPAGGAARRSRSPSAGSRSGSTAGPCTWTSRSAGSPSPRP